MYSNPIFRSIRIVGQKPIKHHIFNIKILKMGIVTPQKQYFCLYKYDKNMSEK